MPETPEAQEQLMTPAEAAKLKGVSRITIYSAVAQGRLPHTRVLGHIALRRADVLAWTPVAYAGRPGRKGGRPQGLPTSEETRARLSQAMKQSWARRKQNTKQNIKKQKTKQNTRSKQPRQK